MLEPTSNVIPFRKRTVSGPAYHPKGLVTAVYSTGSLAVRADDIATKTAALMLQGLGFLLIEEILADGTPRRLRRGEAREAMDRPWRLLKPAFSGQAGVPDADGAFVKPA